MIFLKPGVDARSIQSEILLGLMVAKSVYDSYNVPLWVTSIRDGKHMDTSLHYRGLAVDLRLPSVYSPDPGVDERVVEDLKAALQSQFDVVLERDHIHLEFDVLDTDVHRNLPPLEETPINKEKVR